LSLMHEKRVPPGIGSLLGALQALPWDRGLDSSPSLDSGLCGLCVLLFKIPQAESPLTNPSGQFRCRVQPFRDSSPPMRTGQA
jgi:hypothetical protein